MNRAKVITMVGSLKFKEEIIAQTEKLELNGNCVLSIVYPTSNDKDSHTEDEHKLLETLHKQKIDMSDAIFVVNVNNYIGTGTKKEIEYAIDNNKEVMWLESPSLK